MCRNLTDVIITCNMPSLATPRLSLVLWRVSSPAFSPNAVFCCKDAVDSDELQTFPRNGQLPKKAIAANQPNGNHDISLNSEPDLPFFPPQKHFVCHVPWEPKRNHTLAPSSTSLSSDTVNTLLSSHNIKFFTNSS